MAILCCDNATGYVKDKLKPDKYWFQKKGTKVNLKIHKSEP